jgi:ferritin-like metal-binding protein YciE
MPVAGPVQGPSAADPPDAGMAQPGTAARIEHAPTKPEAPVKSMNGLMLHFLQDIYYAEKLGLRSMAKVAKAVSNPELRDAILHHREQTQGQIERLDQVFGHLGKKARGKTCAAMDGLVEEGAEAMEEADKGPVLDAALIACGQAIDHYEIARYGAMAAWARQSGQDEIAGLLQQTLDEEKANDRLMNEIAERAVNEDAKNNGEEDEDDGEGKDESQDAGAATAKASGEDHGDGNGDAGKAPAGKKPAKKKPATKK